MVIVRTIYRPGILCALILASACSSPVPRTPAQTQTLAELISEVNAFRDSLARPLVLGASVSAGFGTHQEHPVAQILNFLDYSDPKQIRMRALGGAVSAYALKALSREEPANYSWIAALDVYYWDSVLNTCQNALLNIPILAQKLRDTHAVYALGTVPEIHFKLGSIVQIPQNKDCVTKMNEQIRSACAADSRCALVDLNAFVTAYRANKLGEFFAARGLSIDEPKTPLTYPDGLHINPEGARYLAILTLLALRDQAKLAQ